MTSKEILDKAIKKAIDGGFNILFTSWTVREDGAIEGIYRGEWLLKDYHVFIFNHDFAKALWGEGPYYRFVGDTLDNPRQWQYQLQMMVVAEDPIKYLGENCG